MRDSRAVFGIALALLLAAGAGCGGKKAKPPKDKYAGMTAAQIYQAASAQVEDKKYARARETLQAALGRADITPELTATIHLALAEAYFLDGGLINLAEALSRYTNFLTFYPNHDRADYVQYQLGLCYLKQSASPDRDQTQTRKALAELTKVEAEYPGSEYIGAAGQKAIEARELLAEHEFRIGNFYFRRHRYPGAVDRFKQLLDAFPAFSRRDKVYLLLGQSLFALQKEDEGRLYLRRLMTEFPDSRHAEDARLLLTPPALRTAAPSKAVSPAP